MPTVASTSTIYDLIYKLLSAIYRQVALLLCYKRNYLRTLTKDRATTVLYQTVDKIIE